MMNFFGSWEDIGRVLLFSAAAYAALLLMLRAAGNRSLSKLNAFDLVITVALGSTLASIVLSKDVALLDGISALGMLLVLQYLISWGSMRSKAFEKVAKSEPALLLYGGRLLPTQMSKERVTEREIEAAVRASGLSHLREVEAVVLETSGSLSVIPRSSVPAASLLQNVRKPHFVADRNPSDVADEQSRQEEV